MQKKNRSLLTPSHCLKNIFPTTKVLTFTPFGCLRDVIARTVRLREKRPVHHSAAGGGGVSGRTRHHGPGGSGHDEATPCVSLNTGCSHPPPFVSATPLLPPPSQLQLSITRGKSNAKKAKSYADVNNFRGAAGSWPFPPPREWRRPSCRGRSGALDPPLCTSRGNPS